MGRSLLKRLRILISTLIVLTVGPVVAQVFEESPPEEVEEAFEGAVEEVMGEEPEYEPPSEEEYIREDLQEQREDYEPPDRGSDPEPRRFSPRGRPDPGGGISSGAGNAFGTSSNIEFKRTGEKLEQPQRRLEERKNRLEDLKQRMRKAER